MLGAVHLRHEKGTIKLSLEDGVLIEGEQGAYWFIEANEDDDFPLVPLNDLGSLQLFVSGARLQKETIGFDGGRTFVNTWRNGSYVFGLFDEETIQGMVSDALVDALQRVLSGERLFPETSNLGVPCVVLPFESVEKVLDVLGIDDHVVLANGDEVLARAVE